MHRQRLRRLAGSVALVLLAVLLAAAPTALDEDGPALVDRLAYANGWPTVWYHAAYLPMGWFFDQVVPGVGALRALQIASAVSAVLALWFVHRAARDLGGSGCLALIALAASPGWWVNGSRVEVHAVQMLGAGLLVWVLARRRDRALRESTTDLVLLAAACAFAVAAHRSNIGLLLAVPLVGAVRSGWRAALPATVVAGVGALAGEWLNALYPFAVQGGSLGGSMWLLSEFHSDFDLEFLMDEIVRPWFPILALVGVALFRRPGREALALGASALPLLLAFAWFAVPTSGGYFAGPLVLVATAAGSTFARGRSLGVVGAALVGVVAAAGLWLGVGTIHGPERAALADVGRARFELASAHLPDGGYVLSVDLSRQTLSGRDDELLEYNLAIDLEALIAADGSTTALVERVMRTAHALHDDGRVLAIDRGWRPLVPFEARIGTCMGELEARFATEFEGVETAEDAPFLVVPAAP
ncbi:hypothetical protein Pla163_10360 [Planctomycetes bacterium Pla163]|uniref:Glycosyltransferase RgtA/B/C/D-like domain-containing protein n=1 Tax=Rohdeia mirabilis TaxID=2528008 RepID=A0A518CXI1_9BACT|nr:hypothetical protein Pla163_10360 [Planctomycetes bacterium Pla163]